LLMTHGNVSLVDRGIEYYDLFGSRWYSNDWE
jgi:hypothetical protein